MDNEKIVKVTKILAVIFLVASLCIALLPCISVSEAMIDEMIGTSIGDNDMEDLLLDSFESGITDQLNGGLAGNLARSSEVILGALVVLAYSNNKFVAMLYFLILLLGVPVFTILSASFQIWGKTRKKQKLSIIFTVACLLVTFSIFICIPGFLWGLIKEIILEMNPMMDLSLYSGAMRSLLFQIMIRVGIFCFRCT